MGTMILLIAFVTEIAFGAYCLRTRSNQKRMRSVIWVGAFIIFILFALVSLIEWSFRWYLLGALLLIWAMLGSWTLVRNRTDQKTFSIGWTVINTIAILVLVLVAVFPALVFPQYTLPKQTGTHPVATVNYTYTDANRVETFNNTGEKRNVNVTFWFPKDCGGPYPLVLFSHGTGAMKISNTTTFIELAGNGYVVGSIDHPYHSLFTIGSDGKLVRMDAAYWQSYLDWVNHKYDEATGFQLHQQWMKLRAADMNFVLDSILTQVKDSNSAAVYRMIDPKKIGVMGHSLGGEVSALVARQRNDIGAVISLDADMSGEYLDFVNGKNVLNDKPYPIPILSLFAEGLFRAMEAVPNGVQVVAVKRVAATSPNAFIVHLPGTNHFSVTDLPLFSPVLVSMLTSAVPGAGGTEVDPLGTVEKMNALALKFFNAYLKGQGTFVP